MRTRQLILALFVDPSLYQTGVPLVKTDSKWRAVHELSEIEAKQATTKRNDTKTVLPF